MQPLYRTCRPAIHLPRHCTTRRMPAQSIPRRNHCSKLAPTVATARSIRAAPPSGVPAPYSLVKTFTPKVGVSRTHPRPKEPLFGNSGALVACPLFPTAARFNQTSDDHAGIHSGTLEYVALLVSRVQCAAAAHSPSAATLQASAACFANQPGVIPCTISGVNLPWRQKTIVGVATMPDFANRLVLALTVASIGDVLPDGAIAPSSIAASNFVSFCS